MNTIRRAALLLPLAFLMAACGGSKIPDPQKADRVAVDKMLAAATGARPDGNVVLVLPAAVAIPGTAGEELAARFKAGWKVRGAPLVEHRLTRNSDSSTLENPAEFRRFAATVGTLSPEEVAALKAQHPEARLYISFCGLPQAGLVAPGGPRWIAYCPGGAKGAPEMVAAGALIAVVQPRPTAPPPGLDDFDTFYTFETAATLAAPARAP